MEDDDQQPVACAVVTAALPDNGPSGTFFDGRRSFSAMTRQDGTTSFSLRPNKIPGPFQIPITASYQGRTVTALISATNTTAIVSSGGVSKAAIIAIIGGAAAGKSAIDSGSVKALAVTGEARSSALPKVPTFKEGGVPEFDLASWNVLLAPKGTSK